MSSAFDEEKADFSGMTAVDRPFLFVIHDVATGVPLFIGRVTDPTAKP
jgi:serpin B